MALVASDLKSRVEAKIQAVSDFPKAGQTPVFIDDRVLEALCEAIQEWLVQTADVVPTAHSGNNIQVPLGQKTLTNLTNGQGVTVAPQTDVTGKGSLE